MCHSIGGAPHMLLFELEGAAGAYPEDLLPAAPERSSHGTMETCVIFLQEKSHRRKLEEDWWVLQ